jgi:hypothetical protein
LSDRSPAHDDDPRPLPPERPRLEDCCKCSCDPCIFDLYEEAVERYRAALEAWQARQAQRTITTSKSPPPCGGGV